VKSLLEINQAKEILSKYLISQRGGTVAGYEKNVKLDNIPKIDFGKLKDASNAIGKYSKVIYEGIMIPLVKSDVLAARTSWLSFYRKYLTDNKVDFKGWETEGKTPNESAAAYAEHMVSRLQNPNDATAMANLYKEGGKGFGTILKNIVLPFSTFQVNQRMRMTSDVKKIMFGTGEARVEAVKSLAGAIVEQAIFNSIKTYIIATAVTSGANAILSMYGIDTQITEKDKLKKFISNVANDTFLSGLGSQVPYWSIKGFNSIYSAATGDKNKLIYQYEPKEGAANYGAFGTYGVLLQSIASMYEQTGYLDGKADMVIKGGTPDKYVTKEVELSPEEKNIVYTSFLVDALGLAGVSDADVLRMNTKVKYAMQRYFSEKYGGNYKLNIFTKPKAEKEKEKSSGSGGELKGGIGGGNIGGKLKGGF